MKRIIFSFLMSTVLAMSIANAFEPRMRTVYFHDGASESDVVTVMGCSSGAYVMRGNNGKTVVEFLQPCAAVGMQTDGTKTIKGLISVGIVEVMNLISFNVGMLEDGNLVYGTGLSVKFDDSMSLFE